MVNRWVDEHGSDEIYSKFTVIQNSSGQQLPDDEFVFVLRPERDYSAYIAMRVYAASVRYRSPNLTNQINEKLDRIERDNRS